MSREIVDTILDVKAVSLVIFHRNEESALIHTKLEIRDDVGGVLPFDVSEVVEKRITSLSLVDQQQVGVNGGASGRLTGLVERLLCRADESVSCGT
jgi:hypothetical protein